MSDVNLWHTIAYFKNAYPDRPFPKLSWIFVGPRAPSASRPTCKWRYERVMGVSWVVQMSNVKISPPVLAKQTSLPTTILENGFLHFGYFFVEHQWFLDDSGWEVKEYILWDGAAFFRGLDRRNLYDCQGFNRTTHGRFEKAIEFFEIRPMYFAPLWNLHLYVESNMPQKSPMNGCLCYWTPRLPILLHFFQANSILTVRHQNTSLSTEMFHPITIQKHNKKNTSCTLQARLFRC